MSMYHISLLPFATLHYCRHFLFFLVYLSVSLCVQFCCCFYCCCCCVFRYFFFHLFTRHLFVWYGFEANEGIFHLHFLSFSHMNSRNREEKKRSIHSSSLRQTHMWNDVSLVSELSGDNRQNGDILCRNFYNK